MKSATFKMAVAVGFASAFVLVARCRASVTEVVNVEFAGPTAYVGLGAAPDLPGNTHWDDIPVPGTGTSVSGSNLTASDGITPSGVNFSLVATQPNLNSFAGSGAQAGSLMDNFAWINDGNTGTLTLSDLTPGAPYNLYIYAQNSHYSSMTMTFTVGAESLSTANSGNPAGFVLGNNYQEFTDLIANGSGEIVGDWVGNATNDGLNGFQLAELTVPEPSVALLFGIGAGLLWLWRRNR